MNPPHLGEFVRERMDEVGWNVAETAVRLGCERGRLSRLLNGRAGLSADMALALEHIGWGTADHWMRMQAASFFRSPFAKGDPESLPQRLAATILNPLEADLPHAPRGRR